MNAPAPTGLTISPPPWMLAAVAFVSALGPFAIDMYLPALPQMAEALDAPGSLLQMTITAYLIGLAIGPLFLAPLSDAFGRRPVQTGFMAGFGLVSAGCAMAPTAEALVALRVLQALAAGTIMASMRAMLSDVYRGDALSRALSVVMAMFTAAPIVAPVLGAKLLAVGDWRWIFWALVGISAISTTLAALLPETLAPVRRVAYRPRAVVVGYLDILSRPPARRYLASTFAFAAMFFAMLAASPFIFIDHFGLSVEAFGYVFAAISAFAIVSNFVNARLVFRFGYDGMLRGATVGLCLLAAAMGAVAATGFGGVWGVFAAMVWIMGDYHVSIANTLAGLMATAGERAGAASAALTFFRFTGGAVGTAAVGAFGSSAPWPFAVVLCASAAGAALALRIGRG
ncbi:MAG: multidrug effflux MFS transporter [Pseudomonadota bacterium]